MEPRPSAVAPTPFAVAFQPSAAELAALAAAMVPTAVAPSAFAAAFWPSAVELSPLAMAFWPTARRSRAICCGGLADGRGLCGRGRGSLTEGRSDQMNSPARYSRKKPMRSPPRCGFSSNGRGEVEIGIRALADRCRVSAVRIRGLSDCCRRDSVKPRHPLPTRWFDPHSQRSCAQKPMRQFRWPHCSGGLLLRKRRSQPKADQRHFH